MIIGKISNVISQQEIEKLFYEYKNGSIKARNQIIEHNLKLIIFVIKQFPNYDGDELFSVGCEGLINAVNTYDLTRNINFSTYATKCIYNRILVYINKCKNDSNLISIETVITNYRNGKQQFLKDTLASDENMIENYEKQETYISIQKYINELDERSKLIMKLYYGFDNYECHTQTEIARIVGLAQSNICRIIDKCNKIICDKLNMEKHKKKIKIK